MHIIKVKKITVEKVKVWFLKSAEKDLPRAQYYLGLCFEYGFGTESDDDKAYFWYNEAAKRNYEDAIPMLARFKKNLTGKWVKNK